MRHRAESDGNTTVLTNGLVVTGDGRSPIENGAVIMANGMIIDVSDRWAGSESTVIADLGLDSIEVVDVNGDIVLPGLINPHAHLLVDTPFSASAGPSPGGETVAANRDRHLLQGHTTVVNVDSFTLPSEAREADVDHPLKLEYAACPSPVNFEAADQTDGSGLSQAHRNLTIQDVVNAGAVLLGEVGSGTTLAGSSQRYMYFPNAIEDRTGIRITPIQAGALIEAVIGPDADPSTYDEQQTQFAIDQSGLADHFDPADIRDLVHDVTLEPVKYGRAGFEEVGDYAAFYGLPVLVHNSAVSKEETRALAKRDLPLIAGHSNHPTFEPAGALEFARELHSYDDVIVEINSWDLFTEPAPDEREHQALMEQLFCDFITEGVVDTIATDYAGGDWESLLLGLDHVVSNDVASLADAVQLATGNVAEALPMIGATRGTLEQGKAADVLIVNRDDFTDIQEIYIDGTLVVQDGERMA